MPPGRLQAKLRNLIVMQRVQPYWFMWALSDEELQSFFRLNSNVAKVTGHLLPVTPESIIGGLTVAGLATAVYEVSARGGGAVAREQVRALASSRLVEAISKSLGVSERSMRGTGSAAIPIAIVVSGLNVMARNGSERARRELTARGLLAYRDL